MGVTDKPQARLAQSVW